MVDLFIGLEGAQNTSWAELAPSERTAMAYAFIHEEDTWLSLKFLARTMASFGGSKGALSALICCEHSIRINLLYRSRCAVRLGRKYRLCTKVCCQIHSNHLAGMLLAQRCQLLLPQRHHGQVLAKSIDELGGCDSNPARRC